MLRLGAVCAMILATGLAGSQVVVRYVAPPLISGLSPSTGAVGTSVTISGSGFGSSQDTGSVSFNGVTATVTNWGDTSITATVPTTATTGTVYVFANGVRSTGIVFTVTANAASPIAAARQPAGNTSVPNSVWASAGLESGIGTGLSRCTTGTGTSVIAAYTGTAATINTAISGCDAGHYVELGTGTFTLSSAVLLSKSGVSLRGQGADSTKLMISGTISGGHFFYHEAILFCAGATAANPTGDCGLHQGTTENGGSGPQHSATWTAGYAQGTTAVTLSSITGLTVGSTLVLDQVDDATDGYPSAGDIYICRDDGDTAGRPCSYEGGGSYYRTQSNRSQLEFHAVTACGTSTPGAACTSTSVTISPGVYAPNVRSGQSPGAWWGDTTSILTNAGVDDVTIDWTAAGAAVGVLLENCTNCWVRGSRLIYNSTPGNFLMHLLAIQVMHNTYEGNYLYGPVGTAAITNYAYSMMDGSLNLFQNNVMDANVISIAPDDPESANVVAYNYVVNSGGFAVPGFQPHQPGDVMQLYEGNDIGGFLNDVIHGTHIMGTLLRNYVSGKDNSPNADCSETCSGITLETYSRFYNLLGNVISSSAYTTYESDYTAEFPAGVSANVYIIGWRGTHGDANGTQGCDTPNCPSDYSGGNDDNVGRTLFRWGNWDNVTAGVNKNTSNDQTGTKWSASEVPSGITNYPNAVPSAQTVPSSLYLSSKPSWFGTRPLPMIGPDVVNGTPITNTGAHVYKIPARYRYENATNDGNYATSSPRIKSGVTCGAAAACPTP